MVNLTGAGQSPRLTVFCILYPQQSLCPYRPKQPVTFSPASRNEGCWVKTVLSPLASECCASRSVRAALQGAAAESGPEPGWPALRGPSLGKLRAEVSVCSVNEGAGECVAHPRKGDLLQVRRDLRKGREGEGVKEAVGSRGLRVRGRRGSQAPRSHNDCLSSLQLRELRRGSSVPESPKGPCILVYFWLSFSLSLSSTR